MQDIRSSFLPVTDVMALAQTMLEASFFPMGSVIQEIKIITNEQFQNFNLVINLSDGPCILKFFLHILLIFIIAGVVIIQIL